MKSFSPKFKLVALVVFIACGQSLAAAQERTFGEDVEFLRRHVETIVVGDPSTGPAIAVVPGYQARVMTSTATGNRGNSFGWINYQHIESGKNSPHINVFGGEERFWLGPEGGQFSIFFPPGAKFEFEQWQTPALIDTASYGVVKQQPNKVTFRHEANNQELLVQRVSAAHQSPD